MRFSLTLSVAALAGLAVASPVEVRAAPQTPSTDPFYAAPANINSLTPGAIVRTRAVPNTVVGDAGNKLNYSAAYQIAYRTTNNAGAAEVAVTTLLVPKTGDPTKLVSYQVAEDAAYVNCAPSYSIQSGGPLSGLNIKLEMSFVDDALDLGYYVVIPDYEGPYATFLANAGAGQRVLDSIRAALKTGLATKISPSAKVALWGYSGGSIASGFAGQLQTSYAPELKIVGAALGGTVPNIQTTLYAVNKSPFAGLIPAGILGLANAYPELKSYLNTVIVPSKNATFQKAATQCLIGDITGFAFQDIFTYVNTPNAFSAPVPSQILAANLQGQKGIKAPVYIYKGAKDTISPINDTQILVNNYCGFGTSVNYTVYTTGTHISTLSTGAPDALTWITARLAGVGQSGCTTANV